MPKVSVIMPVYNGERFVAEAIESVLSQTFIDWKLIVVDDGSTDRTPYILSRYTDPRIEVIRQKNGGEASARNTALDAAKGIYLTFLDADDLYFPNALCDFVTYFENHPNIDLVYSDGVICDTNKNILMRLSEIRSGVYEGYILDRVLLSDTVITVPVCVALRRQALERACLRFDATLRYAVDWDLWIRLALVAEFGYLDRMTCQYRIHQDNMTSTASLLQRKRDLFAARHKVLIAPWFSQLSTSTKSAFFYQVLVFLLGDQPEQQRIIVNVFPFLELPGDTKADLLRQIASHHLSHLLNIEFAVQCLNQSVLLQPQSIKSRVLLWLANRSPFIAAIILSTWRIVNDIYVRIRSVGHRQPKPVPKAFLPFADK